VRLGTESAQARKTWRMWLQNRRVGRKEEGVGKERKRVQKHTIFVR